MIILVTVYNTVQNYFLTWIGKSKLLEASLYLHIDAYNLTTFNEQKTVVAHSI